ncbi:TRAP transporter small permease [Pseudocolwellia sp. HL-MZ19]|uniref:TRAP transporter small permease n=1 Tax=Pseudocolwellia sp. HL-MZ19 TaxID=3400846 RepID=UPI003CF6889F
MSSIIRIIDKMLSISLMFLMVAIVFAVLWQVLSRYLLQSPSSGSEEIARFLLIWISLLGAAYSYRVKLHLGLDIVTKRMPDKQQKLTAIFCHVVVLIFSLLVLVLGGSYLVLLTLNPIQISPALGIYIGYVYMVLPLTGFLMSAYALNEIVLIMQNNLSVEEY